MTGSPARSTNQGDVGPGPLSVARGETPQADGSLSGGPSSATKGGQKPTSKPAVMPARRPAELAEQMVLERRPAARCVPLVVLGDQRQVRELPGKLDFRSRRLHEDVPA